MDGSGSSKVPVDGSRPSGRFLSMAGTEARGTMFGVIAFADTETGEVNGKDSRRRIHCYAIGRWQGRVYFTMNQVAEDFEGSGGLVNQTMWA